MIDIYAIAIVISALVSLGFTVFLTKKAEKKTRDTLESLGTELHEGLVDINTQLKPIIDTNSRVMGVVSSLGNETKMEGALERRIGLDVLDQNDEALEVIKMAFPRVAEYLEERPEAISKLLPRLNTLISDPEARKRLSLTGSFKAGDISRIHAEERD